MDSAAVILNPTAGPPRRRLDASSAGALLRREGFAVEVCLTTRRGEATELAARAAERHPIVAAAGGDGTCREVAIGLLQTGAALAVLPTGSGNDFARGLGIRDAPAGAAAAGRRATRQLDVGYLAGRPFVNSAGLFLSGDVSRRAGRIPRARPARCGTFWAALAAMLAHRPLRARWELDGGGGGQVRRLDPGGTGQRPALRRAASGSRRAPIRPTACSISAWWRRWRRGEMLGLFRAARQRHPPAAPPGELSARRGRDAAPGGAGLDPPRRRAGTVWRPATMPCGCWRDGCGCWPARRPPPSTAARARGGVA